MGLPLQRQSQFVLLRASLVVRMAHLKRTVPYEILARHIGEVENVIFAATASIFRLQRELSPTYVLTDVEAALQMRLPLRHGGFGLPNTTPAEADAALLSGVAMAQSNLAEGLAACQPFGGLMRTSLIEAWHRVFKAVNKECGCGPL